MNIAPSELVVEAHDETTSGSPDVARWQEVAEGTLAEEGVTSGRLDLIFVEPDEIAALNAEHLGHTGPTDVLAFPLDGPGTDPIEVVDDGLPRHLGDVVICPAVAERQAAAYGGTVDAELTLLVVHGVLHVLGHDHVEPEETSLMQERERLHLSRYGFAHPVAS